MPTRLGEWAFKMQILSKQQLLVRFFGETAKHLLLATGRPVLEDCAISPLGSGLT